MQLLLKDVPLLDIQENGICTILDFNRLPFALRKENSMLTFEEFQIFCGNYGLDAYEEAEKLDKEFYLKMQIADYLLNNNDRHEQNWGFFMENATGKLTGYCPLFDHDHAFAEYSNIMSQTRKEEMTLYEAASMAQKELGIELKALDGMERPKFLKEEQWKGVLERKKTLCHS